MIFILKWEDLKEWPSEFYQNACTTKLLTAENTMDNGNFGHTASKIKIIPCDVHLRKLLKL
jgi:hypothetical protein